MEASGVTPTRGFDGTVLEISVNGGAFADIITAGGAFTAGGYTRTIDGGFGNPLANRPAWSGLSEARRHPPTYITTTVTLPPSAAGQNIKLKWRTGTDNSDIAAGTVGVRIDTISISTTANVCSSTPVETLGVRGDFDGDHRTDLAVYRPTEGNWYLQKSGGGFQTVGWGLPGDKFQPGDINADGKTDFVVFRPSNNTWYGLRSDNFTVNSAVWGVAGDIPCWYTIPEIRMTARLCSVRRTANGTSMMDFSRCHSG
jgi:hypothetical protein